MRAWAVFLFLLVCWIRTAAAQDTSLAAAAARLRTGQLVRVELRGMETRLTGTYVAYRSDSLVLARAAPLATDQVRALWVRGSGWKTGAVIGGALGGLTTGFLGAIICAIGQSESPDGPSPLACAVVGGAMGAAAGGAMGALVGAAVPTWRLRLRVPI